MQNETKIHMWTIEEKKYLKEITPRRYSEEILELMNEKFEYQFNLNQIRAAIKRYKLKTGIDTKFQKGHIPPNKGTKGIMKANKTSFKKGNIPSNKKPLGSERINVDGYTEIKVEEPNKWALKQRVMYEKYHNIKLNSEQIILFLNGDKRNFTKENLYLIDKTILAILNRKGLINDDRDLTKVGINIAKLLKKINEVKK